jgi:alkylmercury lyase
MQQLSLETITKRLFELSCCGQEDLELCSQIVSRVIAGKPIIPTTLSSSLQMNQHQLSQRLARLSDVEVDDMGQILGWGFTLVPTPHQIQIRGKQLFAWCAFDTIQFPPALHVEAQVQSTCSETSCPIRFVVTSEGEVRDLTPAQAQMSLLLPDPGSSNRSITSVRITFCQQSLFFQSEQAASTFLATHPTALLLSLEEAAIMGRLIAQRCSRTPR